MSLRVMAMKGCGPLSSDDKARISKCLQTTHDGGSGRGWSLRAPECQGADLDSQVQHILGQLTKDLAAWQSLRTCYRIDLFVGLFMESLNRGVTLLPTSMQALASRGILLGLDIYGPVGESSETDTLGHIQ